MIDKLIDTLSGFGFPVLRQGSILPEETFPDNFFTFWNADSSDGSAYDNRAIATVYDYQINFYSNDAASVYDVTTDAIGALRSAGFIISGDAYDVDSDEPTHDGRGFVAHYIKY